MLWQDIVLIVESVAILKICYDDHAMLLMAEEALKVSKESLVAQKEYLALRRRWYESRTKKKENDKTDVGPSPGNSPNSQ
jgi:hypothetical protein